MENFFIILIIVNKVFKKIYLSFGNVVENNLILKLLYTLNEFSWMFLIVGKKNFKLKRSILMIRASSVCSCELEVRKFSYQEYYA